MAIMQFPCFFLRILQWLDFLIQFSYLNIFFSLLEVKKSLKKEKSTRNKVYFYNAFPFVTLGSART